MSESAKTESIAHEVQFAADQAFASGNISGIGMGGAIIAAAYGDGLELLLALISLLSLTAVGVLLWWKTDRVWP